MEQTEMNLKINVTGEKQYLTFLLKDELFGLEVSPVKEIIEYFPITRIPMMPAYILGITNVRGDVLPVIDLSERINLGVNIKNKKTCIVIVEIDDNDGKLSIGILIDAISQVIAMPDKNLENTPEFGLKVDERFIKNMLKTDDKFIGVLNLETILNIEELSALREDIYQY